MKRLNVLVSSAGRRLQLIDCFREALRDHGVSGSVFASDCSPFAPAFHLADRAWQLPRCSDPDFIRELLALAEREDIGVIVPTIDLELKALAQSRSLFQDRGIHVCISDSRTVSISEDKVATHAWLLSEGFPTVCQWSLEDVLSEAARPDYPVILKPRRGSASNGIRRVGSRQEVKLCLTGEEDLIVQSIAEGIEYTTNVYVDATGHCVCAVPHQRLEVRGGEVSKAITVKHRGLMTLARNIAEALPGARGPLNIQCFVSESGDIRVIEINARVGGGYPLAHKAGGKSAHWIVQEALGRAVTASFDGWTDGLVMLRYDQAVFKTEAEVRATTYPSAVVSGVGS